jgi:predicted phosphodiesterase
VNKIEKLTSLLTLWEYKKTKLEQIKNKYKRITTKIGIISDLHIPFFDADIINEFIKFIKNQKIEIIVIAGDLVNFDAFSRYLHLDGVISADKEILLAKKVIEKFVELEKQIIYLKANHELRLEKFLIRNLGNSISEQLLNLGLSFENFFRYKNLDVIDNWWIQIGDCIIAHPEVNSIVRGRPVDWTIEYFETRVKDFNCVIIGHTHKQSKIFRKGKLGIEIGSACKTLDYTTDSKFSAYRTETQYKGFGIAELNKGKINFNNTDFVFVKNEEYLL